MKIHLQVISRLFKLMLLLMVVPLALKANGFNSSVKRVLTKSYNVNNGAGLQVSNKYGKIVLHTWSNNVIKATVTITGYGNSEDEARNIAEAVDIKTSQNSSGDVSFETQYNPGSSGSSSLWSKLFSSSKDSKKYVNIDYDIYLPKSAGNVSLANNYGDIVTDDLPAALSVDINYSNYHLGKIAGNAELNMNYCDGSIDGAQNIKINANYSTLHLNNTGQAAIHSNYSDYDISKASNLQIRGNYCDYSIEEAGSIDSHTTYTDFKIGKITSGGDMKVVYGDLKLKELASQAKSLSLNGTYADFIIGLNTNNALHLKANLTYGDVSTGGLSFKNVSRNENGNHISFEGTNNGGGTMTELVVEGSQTDLKLKTP